MNIEYHDFVGFLFDAVRTKHQVLLENVLTDTKLKFEHLQMAVFYACQRGNLPALKSLKEKGADPCAKIDDNYCLWEAIVMGHEEVVEYLLSIGADIHARTKTSGQTVLHLAAIRGNPNIIRMLIDAGAHREWNYQRVHVSPKKKQTRVETIFPRDLLSRGAEGYEESMKYL